MSTLETMQQRALAQKSDIVHIYNRLKQGYLPNYEQLDQLCAGVESSRLLNETTPQLSNMGQSLIQSTKELLANMRNYVGQVGHRVKWQEIFTVNQQDNQLNQSKPAIYNVYHAF
jgi:hypothetical protein